MLKKLGSKYTASKTLSPLASVWGKTTLNTGSVGGQTLKLEKWSHLFLCPWHFVYQFSTISNKMGLREKLSNTNFHFYCSKKWKFLFKSFSRSPILLEIVENWYTKCQRHKKRCPHFSSLRLCPCPDHTSCIVVLYHTEAIGQRLLRPSPPVYVLTAGQFENGAFL